MGMTRLPKTEHYSFQKLDEGITFGEARREGTALSNTAILDLGGSTVLFDTSLTLRSAREIRHAAQVLTGRDPSLVVNSHWHLDHVVGNQVFAGRPIYATKRTIEILLEKRSELEGELTREKIEADLRELERQRSATTTDFGRAQYDAVLRVNRALLDEAVELKLLPPSKEFDGEIRLPGDRKARLLTFGAAHTESDALLFLEKERILLAGDVIVNENHPNLMSGDPEHWLKVLSEVEGLRPERIVTGHGPLGSMETVATMKDYLSTVLELARESGEPTVPERFRSWTESDEFAADVRFARTRRSSSR